MAQPLRAYEPEPNIAVRSDEIPERFDRAAGQKLHFPKALLEDVESYAELLDRTVGWCLWMAWCMASLQMGEQALASLRGDPMLEGAKIPHQVGLPLGTWRHLTRMAERLDRSKSWLLARAWLLARPRFLDAVQAS